MSGLEDIVAPYLNSPTRNDVAVQKSPVNGCWPTVKLGFCTRLLELVTKPAMA